MEDHATRSNALIERAILNESVAGREIAASFVRLFGEFVTTTVRPLLVEAAARGDEPQLIVNGLAALLRSTADSIEFPLDHPRAGSPDGDPAVLPDFPDAPGSGLPDASGSGLPDADR